MNREERLAADGYTGIEPVLFYSPPDPNGWMSNFSKHSIYAWDPFSLRLVEYPTGEHRFQAMKATNAEDHDYVLAASTAGKAKSRGREIMLREGWGNKYGDLCCYVMFETVLMKAVQHEHIMHMLLRTAGRPIYEDSPTDDIWGWRYQSNHTGKNLLGRCWMDVRAVML